MDTATPLERTTPLHQLHVELGAKLADFAGWQMPIQFEGIISEHLWTRSKASLFDVSHMAQVLVSSPTGDVEQAAAALESLIATSVAGLKPGRQRYGLITNRSGGIEDDLMFARQEDRFYLVCNASRAEHDLGLLRQLDGVEVEHVTDRALLALQGPEAERALARLVPQAAELVFMDSVVLDHDGQELWVSRSGYTGEDGFEISLPAVMALSFAQALLEMDEVAPAGLGARDSLRLEAGFPLYGHELTDQITPAAAAVGWAIPKVRRRGGSREGGFPGAETILAELESGPKRVRMGLKPVGRAPIREGVELFLDEGSPQAAGSVTSGGYSPSLEGPIAMAILPAHLSPGDVIFAELRGRRVPVEIYALPFIEPSYKR